MTNTLRVANSVTAVAHPNIALSKYWGKLSDEVLPATPSVSLTVGPFHTRTTVTRSDEPGLRLRINGMPGKAAELARLERVLASLAPLEAEAWVGLEVDSVNDFPTSSGLASSASGLAAFAVAAASLLRVEGSTLQLARAAACGSLSAARSLWGGAVQMNVQNARLEVAPFAASAALELRLVVAVMTESAKAVSSSHGMRETRAKSPYYEAWTGFADETHKRVTAALAAGDFEVLGEAVEASSFAMHGAALAAGVLYMHEQSMGVVRAVRASGAEAYVTFDAGPHPKFLCRAHYADALQSYLGALPGVLRAVVLSPADGARVVRA